MAARKSSAADLGGRYEPFLITGQVIHRKFAGEARHSPVFGQKIAVPLAAERYNSLSQCGIKKFPRGRMNILALVGECGRNSQTPVKSGTKKRAASGPVWRVRADH